MAYKLTLESVSEWDAIRWLTPRYDSAGVLADALIIVGPYRLGKTRIQSRASHLR